jgi:hypothetical protein
MSTENKGYFDEILRKSVNKINKTLYPNHYDELKRKRYKLEEETPNHDDNETYIITPIQRRNAQREIESGGKKSRKSRRSRKSRKSRRSRKIRR